jgi:hypothetical protein
LDEIFEDIAERLEKQFPTIEFRVVELAENQVNFIYAGRKEQMEAPNYCPAEARSSTIAKEVCAKQGHDIRVFQGNTRATPQGPVMEAMNFCTRCGFSVNEVRGQVEEMFRAAVGNEVNKRIGAQAAALAAQGPTPPSGEPGEKIIELPSGTAAEVARTAKAAATEA